ncbi:UDP-N-acetylglucosamine pyrophosphorylase [Deinococcus geothermalis DSM 11300]|uniref:Bifunctional protein GlmU n=1 Tax=Deinococcus geothermalis (strain DSM 11300 / CIP 105573 / AG-3a) TaxID=319795 RepID=GLMU_DEIGD|nr:bifunctional UDP-N-acetylglucosamine diphosphorylase/glucosamine-1-phosphate N-acetyltransferase GlmU [Deinococcus geothermalis]Q1IWX3.1 RecName: Full=Bifunctional protein GlmU; Includes: RecName: Full=UDP-N-acetylglucosamine pyrophosphorylase; AltName: Full=N-acetylglucosamine-1-phosphate uridyltransferase; Includes: RecName: Full=Glucosamine-1-phosphate N-acetyltransferase [Deinococcus geothermalis DSM 11300]ABF46261.1 UDP-N-acetylglucosamine pyrophosphorylase [Deinococcus geothermalis DSM 1
MTHKERPLDVVILAAGQGTRMKSALPKVLHPVAGRPMVAWAVKAAKALGARDIVVVTGHGAEQVEAALAGSGVRFARQAQQLGTGNAFLVGAEALRHQGDADILVLYGDTPLLRPETLRALLADHRAHNSALTILTAELPDATGYGRILRDADGHVERIVEEKAATPEEKAVREFNSGVYVLDARAPELARRITNDNPAGEYYLTDLLELYRQEGAQVRAFKLHDPDEVMGANDRVQLAQAAAVLRRRINTAHMQAGVTLQDPSTIQIEDTVTLGRDVTLEPGVILRGQTRVADGVTIGAYSVVTDSVLEEGVIVKPHSVLEGAHVGKGSDVGPFARLRPGTVLEESVHIGNFVETKNARLAEGVKAGHLAYLGDVTIGAETNVGAGTIIANFDGVHKHQSTVGAGVFIGSNATLIAPRVIGDAAFIAAGSAVHADVPEGALAIARGKQRTLEGWSRRYWSGMHEGVRKKLPWLAGWLERQ